MWPTNEVINIQMAPDRKKVPHPCLRACSSRQRGWSDSGEYAGDKTLLVKMSLKRTSTATAGDRCEETAEGSEKGTVLRNRSAGQLRVREGLRSQRKEGIFMGKQEKVAHESV